MSLLAAAFVIALLAMWGRSGKRYPPGPKRYPLLGNLFDVPKAKAYEKFAQYSKELNSDIVYLSLAGTPFLVLNSLEASIDLLDKRAVKYSDRYRNTMGYELVEGWRLFSMLPSNNEWRESRRILVKHLSAPDQAAILSRIRDFTRKSLLPNLLLSPEDFLVHLENGVGGSMISLTYGLPIKRVADPWVSKAGEGMRCLTGALVPGKYVVDIFPFLKYLPEWFPGAGFQKVARQSRDLVQHFFSDPFEATKKGMVDGSVRPSFLSRSLEEAVKAVDKEHYERLLENIGGVFLLGGTDTSVTVVKSLIAVLLLHPEVQAKAQAEIDAVIGSSRLPDFDDKLKLPYVNAVAKEVLRWQPPGPLGFPHVLTEDDTYRGYFIPKGSVVLANTWAIMHDEKAFPNPSEFNPEHFLTPSGQLRTDVPDPEVVATFGFGRRICPGMNVGLSSVWLAIASIIACFNISPAVDKDGKPEVPKIEYLGQEIVSYPEPFKCRIIPRSNEAVCLIQSEYDESSEYI